MLNSKGDLGGRTYSYYTNCLTKDFTLLSFDFFRPQDKRSYFVHNFAVIFTDLWIRAVGVPFKYSNLCQIQILKYKIPLKITNILKISPTKPDIYCVSDPMRDSTTLLFFPIIQSAGTTAFKSNLTQYSRGTTQTLVTSRFFDIIPCDITGYLFYISLMSFYSKITFSFDILQLQISNGCQKTPKSKVANSFSQVCLDSYKLVFN